MQVVFFFFFKTIKVLYFKLVVSNWTQSSSQEGFLFPCLKIPIVSLINPNFFKKGNRRAHYSLSLLAVKSYVLQKELL